MKINFPLRKYFFLVQYNINIYFNKYLFNINKYFLVQLNIKFPEHSN